MLDAGHMLILFPLHPKNRIDNTINAITFLISKGTPWMKYSKRNCHIH